MAKGANLIGHRFGKLIVTLLVPAKPRRKWLCQCECGGSTITDTGHLNSGNTRSCGCGSPFVYKHGLTDSPLMTKYYDMKRRCYSPGCSSYRLYGGRGIEVCEEWKNDHLAFYRWAMANGYRDDLEIDRIDPDGNYTPDNCRFVTHKENSKNRRIVRDSLAQTARKFGLTPQTVYSRIRRGWTLQKALDEPVAGKSS
ncbi:MAG: hypothetical protein HQL64_13030 [Magnetococcales bacterium]|nr:hypothetical protein [Magnetococcales bacterium]